MIYLVEIIFDVYGDQLKKELSIIVDGKIKIENEIKKCKDLIEKGILEIKEFFEILFYLRDILDRFLVLLKLVFFKFFLVEILEIVLK